ncbi:MAG TPA: hypothetical protein VM733_19190 [Thermoanaerobaculia bacterium]|nr:hypothetical protein [Thermoanaerobaculia bacterium]
MDVSCPSLYTPRDARNLRIFNGWLLGAMAMFVAATILLTKNFVAPVPIGWVLTVATIALLALAARAYIVFLRDADELLRKIQLEALALSFGAAFIFMLGWRLCERLGAPKLDVDDPFIVMSVVWALGQWTGFRRYGMRGETAP